MYLTVVTALAHLLSAYVSSKIKSLTRDSWYDGCITAHKQSVVGFALLKNSTVVGYRADSSTPAVAQIVESTPAEPVDGKNAQTFGTFLPAFQDLQTVDITYKPALMATLLVDKIGGSMKSRDVIFQDGGLEDTIIVFKRTWYRRPPAYRLAVESKVFYNISRNLSRDPI